MTSLLGGRAVAGGRDLTAEFLTRALTHQLGDTAVTGVQATRVGVRSGGCGAAAGPLSKVMPIARQIAFQVSGVGPSSWYRASTTNPSTIETLTSAAVNHQPIRGQGLSRLGVS